MAVLRSKLPKYLKELVAVYERQSEPFKRELITNCRWSLREDTEHDNWNGGMDGHTVVLFVQIETVAKVTIQRRSEIAEEILGDLRGLNSVDSEYFAAVRIEGEDEGDPEFQAATSFSVKPTIDPDSVGIWKSGLARVFMSHRDKDKVAVRAIADALEDYGVCCFVAHETIPDDEDWVEVIKQGLETMEVMVAVTTDDFANSVFCMQEVGYALGKGIPVISLKVSKADPAGFIAHKQGARCGLDQPITAAAKLFPLIGKRLSQTDRFCDVLVQSFCESPDFTEAKNRFERMKRNVDRLTTAQIERIANAFESNNQLFQAGHLISRFNRLVNYLDGATDGKWKIEDRALVDSNKSGGYDDLDEDIPF